MARAQHGAQMLDHFRHPRHVGAFDGVQQSSVQGSEPARVYCGQAGAVQEGGLVQIQLLGTAAGRVCEARFKAYGGPETIAAASWASEWLTGKSRQQAAALSGEMISSALQLPAAKVYCALLVEDAAHAALAEFQSEQE